MKQASRAFCVAALVLGSAVQARADLSSDLADLVAKFDGIRNDKTPLGVTDGNPLAATSFMATSSYENFGLRPRLSTAPKGNSNNWTCDFSGGGGGFDAGKFDGSYATAEVEFATRFTDTVGLSVLIPFEYRGSEHTSTYIGGIEVGLPIVLVPDEGKSLSWLLTPSVMAAGGGFSAELAQGGYIFGGGITSSLAWRSGPLTLTMANQITYAWGRPIGYDEDFSLRQDIEQSILKNGLGAAYTFEKSVTLDGSVSYSCLLNDAYIDEYWSADIGVVFPFGTGDGMRISGKTDYADNFKTFGGEVQLYFTF